MSYSKSINDVQTPVHNTTQISFNNVEAPLNSNILQQSYTPQTSNPTQTVTYNSSLTHIKGQSTQYNLTPSSTQNLAHPKQSASLDRSFNSKLMSNVVSPQNSDIRENLQRSNNKERDKSANTFSPLQYSKSLSLKTPTSKSNLYTENISPPRRKGNE